MEWTKEKICNYAYAIIIIVFVLAVIIVGVKITNDCRDKGEGYYWDNITVECKAPRPPPTDCNVYYELEEYPCWGNACEYDYKVIWKADCRGDISG